MKRRTYTGQMAVNAVRAANRRQPVAHSQLARIVATQSTVPAGELLLADTVQLEEVGAGAAGDRHTAHDDDLLAWRRQMLLL